MCKVLMELFECVCVPKIFYYLYHVDIVWEDIFGLTYKYIQIYSR